MNRKPVLIALIALGIGVLMLAAACSSSTTTTTTPPPATTTAATTPPTTTPATTTPAATTTTAASGPTFQTLASAGGSIFTSTCVICHGSNGQGTDICPVVMWGSGSNLGTFNGVVLFKDAAHMYNYMSKSMPLTAPGSLTQQQYQELLAYILLQANKVSPSTVYNQNNLSSISIP